VKKDVVATFHTFSFKGLQQLHFLTLLHPRPSVSELMYINLYHLLIRNNHHFQERYELPTKYLMVGGIEVPRRSSLFSCSEGEP